MRCVLVVTKAPETFTVHVFNGDSPVMYEACGNSLEAEALAKQFWIRFVEIA